MGSCPFTADFPVQVPIHGDFPLPCLVTGRQSSLFDSFGVFWLRFWQFHPLLFLPPTALFNIDCFRATQVQSWPYNSPRTAVETHTFTVIECMLRFLSYLNLILNGGPVLRGYTLDSVGSSLKPRWQPPQDGTSVASNARARLSRRKSGTANSLTILLVPSREWMGMGE